MIKLDIFLCCQSDEPVPCIQLFAPYRSYVALLKLFIYDNAVYYVYLSVRFYKNIFAKKKKMEGK